MNLRIITPGAVVLDIETVTAVRAEDETGEFGVLPGHAEFLTVLIPSVVGWRTSDGSAGFCAVRGGVFAVSGGERVSVATREAVLGNDLSALQGVVAGRLAADAAAEQAQRAGAERLRMQAIRQIVGYLRVQPANIRERP